MTLGLRVHPLPSDALAKKGHMGHNSKFDDVPSGGARDDGWDTIDVELDEVVKRCGAQVGVPRAAWALLLAAARGRLGCSVGFRLGWVVWWVLMWVSGWVRPQLHFVIRFSARRVQMREFLELVHTAVTHVAIGLLWLRVAEPEKFEKRIINSTMCDRWLRCLPCHVLDRPAPALPTPRPGPSACTLPLSPTLSTASSTTPP